MSYIKMGRNLLSCITRRHFLKLGLPHTKKIVSVKLAGRASILKIKASFRNWAPDYLKIKVTFHKPSYIIYGSSLSGPDDYVDGIYWIMWGNAYVVVSHTELLADF